MPEEKIPFDFSKKKIRCCNCKREVWVIADLICSPSANYIWTCPNCKTDNDYKRYMETLSLPIGADEAKKLLESGAVFERKK